LELAGFVTTDNGGSMIWWGQDGGVLDKVEQAHGSYIFASACNPRTSEVFTAGDDGRCLTNDPPTTRH
jgi:hypothetical protein